jgi:hypothetical protein
MPKGKGYGSGSSNAGSGSLPRDAARSTQPTNPGQKGARDMGQGGVIRVPNTPLMGHRGKPSGRKG